MKNKLNAMYIGDKWMGNNPAFGPAMHEHIILGSLESTDFPTSFAKFFHDEHMRNTGQRIDGFLLHYCETNRPDVIICSYAIGCPTCPQMETFAKIYAMGIPLVFMWYDMVYRPNVGIVDSFAPLSTVNVVFDINQYPTRFPEKYLNLWAPFDSRIYHDPGYERDINLNFLGLRSPWPLRLNVLQKLDEHNLNVYEAGGEIKGYLPINEYVKIMQRSKMALNFSWASPPADPIIPHQTKGRVFEIMFCGALLLESENDQITRFFIPHDDYVPWANENDLIDKIRYYTEHDDERRRIAKQGHDKAMSHYNAKAFWSQTFDFIGVKYGEI